MGRSRLIFKNYIGVIEGKKTQTRRIVRHGEQPHMLQHRIAAVRMANGNLKWKVDDGRIDWFTKAGVGWNSGSRGGGSSIQPSYAIQSHRTGPALARFRITAIRQEDLYDITWDDAELEGFETRIEFRQEWDRINLRKGDRWEDNPRVWVLDIEYAPPQR